MVRPWLLRGLVDVFPDAPELAVCETYSAASSGTMGAWIHGCMDPCIQESTDPWLSVRLFIRLSIRRRKDVHGKFTEILQKIYGNRFNVKTPPLGTDWSDESGQFDRSD